MIHLSTVAYVVVVLFCIYSGAGVEYRRQRWRKSRSAWDLVRMVLCVTCLLAVVIGVPVGGMQPMSAAVGLAGLVNIGLSTLEDWRPSSGGEGG